VQAATAQIAAEWRRRHDRSPVGEAVCLVVIANG
jgi:hypothetical protein